VASAAYEFIVGPLLESLQRVGKRLSPPRWLIGTAHDAGPYRVIYRVDDSRRFVTVLSAVPRADAYRPH